MTVLGDWPTYLLKNIPLEIRAEIEREAEESKRTLSEVVRGILCERYKMDCTPVRARGRFEVIDGTPTMLLRLQPELFRKIQAEAKRRRRYKRPWSTRDVIIDALTKHYYPQEAVA